MSKYENTVFYDFKSRFLVIFFCNSRHRLVLKIPFPNHIFPKISKYLLKILISRPPVNTTFPLNIKVVEFIKQQPHGVPNHLLPVKSIKIEKEKVLVISNCFSPVCTSHHRSSHRRRSGKSVLSNFGKFTEKHLCQSLFLIKLQASASEKRGSGAGVSM